MPNGTSFERSSETFLETQLGFFQLPVKLTGALPQVDLIVYLSEGSRRLATGNRRRESSVTLISLGRNSFKLVEIVGIIGLFGLAVSFQ